MHMLFHLIPGHHHSGSVGAEYRSSRICQIPVEVIAHGLYHLVLVMAGLIPLEA